MFNSVCCNICTSGWVVLVCASVPCFAWCSQWSLVSGKMQFCFFFHKGGGMFLQTCYKSVEVPSLSFLYGQAHSGWALVSLFPSTSTGCTLHTLLLGFQIHLPTWIFHHKEKYFLVMSKETYKWKCSCLLHFRHFRLCAMCRSGRPEIGLKQIKYSTFPYNGTVG